MNVEPTDKEWQTAYYSALEVKEILQYVTIWKNLEDIMLH